MQSENNYYKESGVIGLRGWATMITAGALGTIVLGGIYGYAILYVPSVYLRIIITAFLGGLTGALVVFSGEFGNIRNKWACRVYGLVFGLFAVYFGWISWIFAYSNQETLALMPAEILDILQYLSKQGIWSLHGMTPRGIELYIVWGIEAAMIAGLSLFVAWAFSESDPFCEPCNAWATGIHVVTSQEPINDPIELKKRLEQGNIAILNSLNRIDSESEPHTSIVIRHCNTCNESNYLTVNAVTTNLDKDGKEIKVSKPILKNLRITTEQFKIIKDHS